MMPQLQWLILIDDMLHNVALVRFNKEHDLIHSLSCYAHINSFEIWHFLLVSFFEHSDITSEKPYGVATRLVMSRSECQAYRMWTITFCQTTPNRNILGLTCFLNDYRLTILNSSTWDLCLLWAQMVLIKPHKMPWALSARLIAKPMH